MQEHWVAHVIRRGLTRDLAAHVLALSAQQVLCTGPLLVAASAVMQRYGLGDALDLLANLLLLTPESTRALAQLMRATAHPSTQTLLLSLGAAVFFGLSVASTIQRMLETMWGLDRLPLSGYWRQVAWIAAVVPVLGAAMYAGHLTRLAPFADGLTVVVMALALGVASMLFSWWTQYLLLGGRVEWRRLLPGSAFIGAGIAIAQAVSNAVVPSQIVEQSQTFGPIGAVFVLTSWVVAIVAVFCGGVLAGAVVDEREAERVQRRRRRLGRPSVPAGRTLRGRRPRAGEAMVGGTPVDPTSPAGPDRTRDRRGGTS
jgi:membrane protein